MEILGIIPMMEVAPGDNEAENVEANAESCDSIPCNCNCDCYDCVVKD
ncbi:MAG: hypothetical protein AAB444_00245 [Patescibacteria group bacterium]